VGLLGGNGWWWKRSGGAAAPGGGTLPALGLFTGGDKLTYFATAGETDNVDFGSPWPAGSVGRVDVVTTAGDCNFTGILAGVNDGQGLLIRNVTGGSNLTLNNLDNSSDSENQITSATDIILAPGEAVILVYDADLELWVISP
jgi:hypothetical protein